MIKTAIIRKLKNNKYRLYSKKRGPDGKRRNLGTFDSLSEAKDHERDIQYFKHHSDDGKTEDKATKMLSDLSDIAGYLEEAGYIDHADKIYAVMGAIDGSFEQDAVDRLDSIIPDAQMNIPGAYIGGEGTANSYSSFSMPEAQPADDMEQDNVDMLASSNGLVGNSPLANQGTGQMNVLNDSYFYHGWGYDGLETPYK